MEQHPFPQDAWTRARDRFVEDLTEAEKQIYYKGSLEMIYYDASSARKRHSEASTSKHLADKLQPLVSAIDQYAEALDVYSNAYPLALSPLWGSLRVILHLAREFGKYFEKLLDMFEQIGHVLPRFQAYERLFPNNERLVQLISIVYVDILKFCSDVKSIFRHGRRAATINLKIFSKLVWKPFDLQFAGYMRKFKDHERNVEKEAKLSGMIESAESRAIVLANRMQLETERKELEREVMLSKLCVISSEEMHMRQRRLCHKGTGLWALGSSQYLKWKAKDGFRALCCYGIPGCGKSVLASTIVEDLTDCEALRQNILYYYCSHADARSLSTRQILGSLLKQLILKGLLSSAAQQVLLAILARDENSGGEDKMAEMIEFAILSHPVAFLVVDGLDECKDETRRYIIDFLNRLIERETPEIRIMVTCRDEGQTLSIIDHWPSIQLSESLIADDLQRFVSYSVRSNIKKGDLKISDASLEQEVVTVLAAKAHGMFLWVHFQLIELCTAVTPSQIRAALQGLPDGLGDTYARILTRILSSRLHWSMATKVFSWLACARRPLKLEEIREAVAFDGSDKAWDADKIPEKNSLLKICQGLVIQDPDDGTVRFAHYTVQQYLFLHHEPLNGASGSYLSLGRDHSPWLLMEEAQDDAADLCITYLNFSDFETAIASRPQDTHFAPNSILGPGGPGAIAGSVGLGKPVFNAIYRVIGRSARPVTLDVDYAKYLNLQPKPAGTPRDEKHAFLGYVLENWPWHVRLPSRISIFRYEDLVVKTLPFEFRPWGPNRHFGPYGCNLCSAQSTLRYQPKDLILTPMMHWAASEGNLELLCLMSQFAIVGLPIGVKDLYLHLLHETYSKETMTLACQMGRTNVVNYLLENYPELCWDPSLFMVAASAGHADILEALRRNHDDEFASRANALLSKAATNGHASVVKYLMKGIVDLEFRDDLTEMTPLQSAFVNGHEEVVRSLAQGGFDIDQQDIAGATLLHYTAREGNLSMTLCLVECGASIASKDRLGRRPLDFAISANHTAITEYLLAQHVYRSTLSKHNILDELHTSTIDWECLMLQTRLWLAAYGHEESLRFVLDQEGSKHDDIHYDFGDGLSLIHVAARFDNVTVIKELEDRGVSLDKKTKHLYTPLHFATRYGNMRTVRRLLHSGAQPSCMTSRGWNPLHFAVTCEGYQCLSLLLTYGADPNAKTNLEQGAETPLLIAVSQARLGNEPMNIRILTKYGAELKMCNKVGDTAYEIAERRAHMYAQVALLDFEANMIDRPQLWHLKRLIHQHQKTTQDIENAAVQVKQFGMEMSDLISNRTFNDHDVIYARKLIEQAEQEMSTDISLARRSKLQLLVFILQQVMTPENAKLKVIPSSESSNDSPLMGQPPNTPLEEEG